MISTRCTLETPTTFRVKKRILTSTVLGSNRINLIYFQIEFNNIKCMVIFCNSKSNKTFAVPQVNHSFDTGIVFKPLIFSDIIVHNGVGWGGRRRKNNVDNGA